MSYFECLERLVRRSSLIGPKKFYSIDSWLWDCTEDCRTGAENLTDGKSFEEVDVGVVGATTTFFKIDLLRRSDISTAAGGCELSEAVALPLRGLDRLSAKNSASASGILKAAKIRAMTTCPMTLCQMTVLNLSHNDSLTNERLMNTECLVVSCRFEQQW